MSLRALLNGQESIVPFKGGDLTRLCEKFYSSVGSPVHTLRPEQNLSTLRQAMRNAGFAVGNTHEMLRDAVGVFRPEFEREIRKISGNDVQETKFRAIPKSISRMLQKESSEGDDGVLGPASHTDVEAVTLFAKTPEAFDRITSRLRPMNNLNTVQLKEKAVDPDGKGFPANTAKYCVTKTVGGIKDVPWIAEIQVLIHGSQKFCDKSHEDMHFERGYEKWINGSSRGLSDSSVLVAAGKLKNYVSRHIPTLNKDMAAATGMDKLRQARSYYLIGDTPVAHVRNQMGDNYCFIPDTATGFYRVENSYLSELAPEKLISKKDFLTYALALVPVPNLALSGKSSRPALALAS